jgi:3-methyl-2-oxobutanoate hydroxymethyltransferase
VSANQKPFPRITAKTLLEHKAAGRKIVCLTAYDAIYATVEEEAGVDLLLIGDSAGNVIAGHTTTIPMTMEAMLFLTRCVARGSRKAMVVADMPFGTFQVSIEDTVRNAVRFLKEGGAQGVKMEGAGYLLETIRRLVEIGIPVMGHVGLTPQQVNIYGGYPLRGKTEGEAEQIQADAKALQDAGVFSIVLEKVPATLAAKLTKQLAVPTIGIGSGPHCDGQILVNYDLLGMIETFKPKFVRRYLQGAQLIRDAVSRWAEDVREGRYPSPEESY